MYLLGGGEGTRTPYLDSAIVALYQMSYTPKHCRLVNAGHFNIQPQQCQKV